MVYATSRSDLNMGILTDREKNPPLTSVIFAQRNSSPLKKRPVRAPGLQHMRVLSGKCRPRALTQRNGGLF